MKKKYTKLQTLWWFSKRVLRTLVPQIPAVLAWLNTVFPENWGPYLFFIGGLLTGIDKLIRDKGWYG